MRDFLNYGDSLDIKYLIITVLFIIIWKLLIEKKKKKLKTLLNTLAQLF